MKVGLIAPVMMLDEYCTTKVQYCVPKLVMDSKPYRDFYRNRGRAGDTVILDCKAWQWKRIPCNIFDEIDSIEYIQPSMVVLPSVMFDFQCTIRESLILQNKLQEEGVEVPRLLGCLEGTSPEEIDKCAKIYLDRGLGLAVPNHTLKVFNGFTYKVDLFLENKQRVDELEPHKGDFIVTSLPIRLGLEGRLLSNYSPTPPSLTLLEEEDKFPEVVRRNIKETLEYYES